MLGSQMKSLKFRVVYSRWKNSCQLTSELTPLKWLRPAIKYFVKNIYFSQSDLLAACGKEPVN